MADELSTPVDEEFLRSFRETFNASRIAARPDRNLAAAALLPIGFD